MLDQPTTLRLFPQLERDIGSFATGIFPRQRLADAIRDGALFADEPFDEGQLQPASIDLRLGATAYEVEASFLAIDVPVSSQLPGLTIARLDLTQPVVLRRRRVYVIQLLEHLRLPSDTLGKANPKSTTGRLDMFTRLIVDGADEFERVPAGYRGPLYVEVSPRSFDITVRRGDSLNQLRLMRGSPPPSDRRINVLHSDKPLVYTEEGKPEDPEIERGGVWVAVDLSGEGNGGIVGYRALQDAPPLDLARVNHYDPRHYWEPIEAAGGQLVLMAGRFYILASRQRISVPPTHAAEMVNYDPSVGEFRIHYAGFFDPGFGCSDNGVSGAKAVLEVRPHEVPFLLRHDQSVGRLVYERLLEAPDRVYGRGVGSSYQLQGLRLSKQFKIPKT